MAEQAAHIRPTDVRFIPEGPEQFSVLSSQFSVKNIRLGLKQEKELEKKFFAPVVQRTRIVGLHPTDAGSTPERRTTVAWVSCGALR